MIKKVPYNFSYPGHTWLRPVIHPLHPRTVYQKEFWELSEEDKKIEYYLVSHGYRESKMRLPTLDTERVCDLRVIAGNDGEVGWVQAFLVPNEYTQSTRLKLLYQESYLLQTAQLTHEQIQDRMIQDHVAPFFD